MPTTHNVDGVFSSGVPLSVVTGAPAAANVLTGFQTFTATALATTIITVPAGRTWLGMLSAQSAVSVAAATAVAGSARAVISVAGAGSTPAAGALMAIEAMAAANAAGGTTGTQGSRNASNNFTIVAPAGNAVLVQVVPTISGTAGRVDAWAAGALI